MSARLPLLAKLGLAAGLALLGWVLCRRGIVLSDEGYLLLQSYDLLHGKVMYRDLDSFVAPGVWFLLAALFRLVEPSVLITRGVALLGYLAAAAVSWRIVRRISGARWAAAAVIAYGVMSVWAFPAWTFSFYSPYSALFALLALDRLLTWGDSRRSIDLLAIGLAVGLSTTFKQNYGAFAAMAAAVGTFCFCLRDAPRLTVALGRTVLAGLWIVAGTVIAIAPTIAYLAANDALGDAFQSLAIAPFTEFATRHAIPYMPLSELWHNTLLIGPNRLLYGAYPLSNSPGFITMLSPLERDVVSRLHVLAYWLPPLLFAWGTALAVTRERDREWDPRIACVLAMAIGVFLGVFPRADYAHLVHVYQPVLPLAAIVVERTYARLVVERRGLGRAVVGTAAVVLAAFGIVAADWVDYIRDTHSARIVHRRGGVLLDPLEADMLNYEVSALQSVTQPGEHVLTMPALSMINFLADRPVPGKYYNLYGVHIGHDEGRGVVEAAERDGVQWVVAHYFNFFSDAGVMSSFAPRLIEYVRRTFKIEREIGTDVHMFMKRRPAPLPVASPVDLRTSCDISRTPIGDRVVISHLLFDTLFHMHGKGKLNSTSRRDTVCTVRVEQGARFYFMVDYRQPSEINRDSFLRARVWAISAADAASGKFTLPDDLDSGAIPPRFALDIPLATAEGWMSLPPTEHTIDLSDIAGAEGGDAVIILRSTFEGDAVSIPYDYRGLGVEWHDLRLGGADLAAVVAGENARP